MTLARALESIERLLGPDSVLKAPEDLKHYGQDWSGVLTPNPSAIVLPRTSEDVSRVLAICVQNEVPVVPSGGRTGLSGGAVATNGEIVLSLSRMNKIISLDETTLTLRVEAGVVTQAVHDYLRPYGLTWPVDFASKGSSQVGGNLATNAGGIRVIRYGNARAWVLSLQFATLEGTLIESNGELEKNASGLDLRHLLIGSEGTLGVITEATLKLVRLPKVAPRLYFFALENLARVAELFSETRRGPFTINAFEYLSRVSFEESTKFFRIKSPFEKNVVGADAFVVLEVEPHGESGEAGAACDAWLSGIFEKGLVLDGTQSESSEQFKKLWQIREGVAESILAFDGDGRERERAMVHQHDVSVPVSALPQFTSDVEKMYAKLFPDFEVFIFGHIGDGNLHIFIRNPVSARMAKGAFTRACEKSDIKLFEVIKTYKGSVSAEHGIGILKRPGLPYTRSVAEQAYALKIKKAFDPQNLLNPGKVY